MTVFEVKGSCEGVNLTSHRGQHGKTARSDERMIKCENNSVDELSEEIAHITLKECRCESAAENDLEGKLEELTINSVLPLKNEIEKTDATSVDTVKESASTEEVRQQIKLEVTEPNEENTLYENEAQKNKSAQKSSTLGLNIIVKEDSKCSIGSEKENDEDSELCPRSPVGRKHANNRCDPYQQGAPRSRHHSSGGFCVAEATTFYSDSHSSKGTNNMNIPIQHHLDTSYTSPPPYPFPCVTSPSEYTDEGMYDVLSPEIIWDQSNCETLPESLSSDVFEVLDLLEKQGWWLSEAVDQVQQPFPVSSFAENNQIQPNDADDTCSPIPLSVAEFDHATTECLTGSRTIDYSPLSMSSGYNSAVSPYSTNSSPSPSSSLKGSQEKINMGCNEQAYGNNGSVVYDTTSPYQASFADTEYTDCSSVQVSNQILALNRSSVYFGSRYEESLLSKPEMVMAFNPKPLAPKPTFSTGSGKERMEKKMVRSKKDSAWVSLSSKSNEVLAAADEDGDTHLMILLLTLPKENDCKLEMIYALVERLSKIENALTAVNRQGQSALYLAALYSPDEHASLITRYIADTLIRIGAPLDTINEGGNTLLHFLCRHGANHYKVLKELLTVNKMQNCFNLNQFNDQGMTPLHVAVTSHQGTYLECSSIVRLLIEAGANATLLTDNIQRCSALSLAIKGSCDPNLIEALLTSASVVASCLQAPYRQETVLHLVAQRNDLPLHQQSKVYKKFVDLKAPKDARDSKGKLPWDLIAADRKEAIKKILQQK